jgi:hypothetical protein
MTDYRPWYERFPERFAEEKADMVKRGFVLDEEAFARQSVVFRGRSRIDPARSLVVEYSDAFPSIPPRVLSETGGKLLTAHQSADSGAICTFGQRLVRWSASLSGTAAIDEAEDVISGFQPGSAPPVEAQQPEPPSATYHYSPDLFFLVPPPLGTLPPNVPESPVIGTFRLLLSHRRQMGLARP